MSHPLPRSPEQAAEMVLTYCFNPVLWHTLSRPLIPLKFQEKSIPILTGRCLSPLPCSKQPRLPHLIKNTRAVGFRALYNAPFKLKKRKRRGNGRDQSSTLYKAICWAKNTTEGESSLKNPKLKDNGPLFLTWRVAQPTTGGRVNHVSWVPK